MFGVVRGRSRNIGYRLTSLTANERTFLGYLRTSIALSMIGIFIAQLYRLQHRQDPDDVFGYFVLSKPLSVIFQTTALGMVLIGSARFYKQQHAMSIGKVHAGGWELASTAIASFLVREKSEKREASDSKIDR